MRKNKFILPIVMALLLVFSVSAYAAQPVSNDIMNVGVPTIKVIGNKAKCSVDVTIYDSYINATLELWQGSTLIASWNNTGYDYVTVSGSATIVHGLTYTLTVSGTANGVAFTPQSITRTL